MLNIYPISEEDEGRTASFPPNTDQTSSLVSHLTTH